MKILVRTLSFNWKLAEKMTVRTASSFISHDQARLNFNREVAGRSLAEVSAEAEKNME